MTAGSSVRAWNHTAYSPNAQAGSYPFANVAGYGELQAPVDDEGEPRRPGHRMVIPPSIATDRPVVRSASGPTDSTRAGHADGGAPGEGPPPSASVVRSAAAR